MSDPITAQEFMAGLSCNSGTREPVPPRVAGETDASLSGPNVMAELYGHYLKGIDSAKECKANQFGRLWGLWRLSEKRWVRSGHCMSLLACEDKETAEALAEFMGLDDAVAAPLTPKPDTLAAENATLREQLADADRTLAGFVKAVREARECIEDVRIEAMQAELATSEPCVRLRCCNIESLCNRWLSPPLAAVPVPAARVLTEGGQ